MVTATAAPQLPATRPAADTTNSKPPGRRQVTFGPIEPRGQSVVIYGGGGTGKTTLACNAPSPVGVIDLERSLSVLRPQLPPDCDLRAVSAIETWQDLRDALNSDGWSQVKTIVLDSATRAEELCAAWVMENIPLEGGKKASRIEDYPYGKGYGFIFDTFLSLLGDLDKHLRAGRHVVLLAHDCVTECPNPSGSNYLRYEPRLQSPASGKNSIRLRLREWADHLLYLAFDVEVQKQDRAKFGKATGGGTRTLHCSELPYFMAKSRTCDVALAVTKNDPSLWSNIIR